MKRNLFFASLVLAIGSAPASAGVLDALGEFGNSYISPIAARYHITLQGNPFGNEGCPSGWSLQLLDETGKVVDANFSVPKGTAFQLTDADWSATPKFGGTTFSGNTSGVALYIESKLPMDMAWERREVLFADRVVEEGATGTRSIIAGSVFAETSNLCVSAVILLNNGSHSAKLEAVTLHGFLYDPSAKGAP